MNAGTPEHVILVVENDTTHAQLIQDVLQEEAIHHQIRVLNDGVQAINYLHQRDEYAEAVRPDLILLDLNLPQKNGQEVLRAIKEDPNFRRIPTVILTTSEDEDDIFKCYQSQGNCYVVKSTQVDQLVAIVKRIKHFWLGIVTLPLK